MVLGLGALLVGVPGCLRAQSSLNRAVEQARRAWLQHDVDALLETSDTIRLQLPGVEVAGALRPGQAARLLERYLAPAQETGLELREIRRGDSTHAYAELDRHHAVSGTSDTEEDTLFFGFVLTGGEWHLVELRVTP